MSNSKRVVHSQARQIIYSVYNSVKKEKRDELNFPLKAVHERVAEATGVSLNTVKKIVKEELLDRIVAICRKYPSPFRLWFGPKFTLCITNVNQAQKIMSSYNFITKDPDLYRFIETFDGKGLITSSGLKWKKDRRLISPTFSKKNVSQYFEPILEQTNILVNILMDQVGKPTFNIEPFVHRCTADFVNRTFLGVDTRAQFGEMDLFLKLLHRMYTIVHARIAKVWLQNEFLFRWTNYWNEHEEGKKVILGFMEKAIEKNNKNLQSKPFQPIICQLMEMRNTATGFCTHQDLKDHLVTLYTASEDTVTTIVSFTLLLLGRYPTIQEKVVDEIYQIVGEKHQKIEEKHIDHLQYLDMVIKDVLRLFPIASFIVRKAQQEVYLCDDCLIPEDCSVIISIYNIHRDREHWKNPNEFYPEHFLPENVRNRHPYAFMPFSAGPRGCIGKNYAYMALKILLVTILQNFIVESDGKLEDLQLKTDISIRPKDDRFPIRLKIRD